MSGVEPLASPLRDEVVELTRALIRVDSSNPPGNETAAAEVVGAYLAERGIAYELIGPDPQRLNLVARIEGGRGPSLMLMGHTDVVPAPREGWSVDPFAAELRDGHLIGRGAADMKNELAARTVAFAACARDGARPPGDVVLVAESDEEKNRSRCGMSWLVRERPDLRCEYALNEGGGMLLELADGRRIVDVGVGEKQVSAIRLRILGTAGHASVPEGADNPVVHLAGAAARLAALRAPAQIGPAVARTLRALGADPEDEASIERARALHPVLAGEIPSMLRMTVTPTGAATHEPSNVIPPFAELTCDCRLLPGQTEADLEAHVAAALGDGVRYELSYLEPLEGGSESPIGTPLHRACEEWVARRVPGAEALPLISAGFSDSYWVRSELGTAAYGFAPIFATDPRAYLEGMHGADERIHVDDLVEIAEFSLFAIEALGRLA